MRHCMATDIVLETADQDISELLQRDFNLSYSRLS